MNYSRIYSREIFFKFYYFLDCVEDPQFSTPVRTFEMFGSKVFQLCISLAQRSWRKLLKASSSNRHLLRASIRFNVNEAMGALTRRESEEEWKMRNGHVLRREEQMCSDLFSKKR